jgi:hypothetical protein
MNTMVRMTAGLLLVVVVHSESSAQSSDVIDNLVLHCEVTCSEQKLRTGVARITWVTPESGLRASGVAPQSLSRPTLDASVFKGRFVPDNFASFPGMEAQAGSRAPELTDGTSRVGRAYDLQMIDYQPAAPAARAAGVGLAAEDAVVVEGLAPGMSYTWRLRFPVDGDFVNSATVSCQAPICPADFIEEQ